MIYDMEWPWRYIFRGEKSTWRCVYSVLWFVLDLHRKLLEGAEETCQFSLWSETGRIGFRGRLSFHHTPFFIIWIFVPCSHINKHYLHVILSYTCLDTFQLKCVCVGGCVRKIPGARHFIGCFCVAAVIVFGCMQAKTNKQKVMALKGFISSHNKECGGRHSRPVTAAPETMLLLSLCSALPSK